MLVKILPIEQLLLMCGFDFHRADLLPDLIY
jgi:hypothetical protein